MEHYLSIIRDCLEIGVSPRCHLEDITRAGYLRLCDSLLPGADESDGSISDSHQGSLLRHHGVWRQLPRSRDPPFRTRVLFTAL